MGNINVAGLWKTTYIYIVYKHIYMQLDKIYCEDCVTFMQSLAKEGIKVNVIVTSPPYNIKKQYNQYNDNKERKEYLDWLHQVASHSLERIR